MVSAKRKLKMLHGLVNRVQYIGIELEGGWNHDPGWEIVRDGSVIFEPPRRTGLGQVIMGHDAQGRVTVSLGRPTDPPPSRETPQFAIGEVVSRPMLPEQ